ncbi:MAG: alcohol dehydrogenase catalytic domain-containing protein [Oscillospiraceae bacterium]|nr:alcohol dehydrogenase catalytic domain-containing protein [Oscillospiraceae bacterium]
MKAVCITEPHVVKVIDVPMPVRNDYECLVEVKACGICSSTDLKLIHCTHPENPRSPMRFPAILGHEAVGVIVEVGSKVRNLKLGDRVLVPFSNQRHIPDDKIDIKYGAMTEYSVAPDVVAMQEDNVSDGPQRRAMEPRDHPCQVFPDDISYIDGAMILSFKETYSAVRNFNIQDGMDVLVFGDGSVGMGLAHFINAYKANSNIVVGHHDDRLKKVMEIAKPSMIINSHKGEMDKIEGQRFDIIVDAVGSTDIIKQGVRMLKPGGKLVVIGVLPKDNADLRLFDIPNYTSVMMHSFPYREHRTQGEIIEFMRSGFVKAADYYSHIIPMDDVAEGVRMLESREAFKVILTMNGGA